MSALAEIEKTEFSTGIDQSEINKKKGSVDEDTAFGMAEITRQRSKDKGIAIGDNSISDQESEAGLGGTGNSITMSGDGRGAQDSTQESADNPELMDPEKQLAMLLELLNDLGQTPEQFSIENVLELLMDDRDVPGLERPSVRRMQQLVQLLYLYSLQHASMQNANTQLWLNNALILRLYQQLNITAKHPNPEAAFKALIQAERTAINELRQAMQQQGVAKIPLSQLTTLVVARQMAGVEKVFAAQLAKLMDLQNQAKTNGSTVAYTRALQLQIQQLRAVMSVFQSPALRPLMDYARQLNAATTQAPGAPGKIAMINPNALQALAAMQVLLRSGATMQALRQAVQVSSVMIRLQQEWAQGIMRVPNAANPQAATQTIRLPDSLKLFWANNTSAAIWNNSLRPGAPIAIQNIVQQLLQETLASRSPSLMRIDGTNRTKIVANPTEIFNQSGNSSPISSSVIQPQGDFKPASPLTSAAKNNFGNPDSSSSVVMYAVKDKFSRSAATSGAIGLEFVSTNKNLYVPANSNNSNNSNPDLSTTAAVVILSTMRNGFNIGIQDNGMPVAPLQRNVVLDSGATKAVEGFSRSTDRFPVALASDNRTANRPEQGNSKAPPISNGGKKADPLPKIGEGDPRSNPTGNPPTLADDKTPKTESSNPKPHYRSGFVDEMLQAAQNQNGEARVIVNGIRGYISQISKGVCETCTGCGGCGKSGAIKQIGVQLQKISDAFKGVFGGSKPKTVTTAPVVNATITSADALLNQLRQNTRTGIAQRLIGRILSK